MSCSLLTAVVTLSLSSCHLLPEVTLRAADESQPPLSTTLLGNGAAPTTVSTRTLGV